MYTYLRRPWLDSMAASRDHSWLGIRWKRVQLSRPKWMLLPLTLCVNVWGSVRTFVCGCIAEKSRAWEGMMSGQSHFVRCHHKNTVTLRGRAQRWRKKGGLQHCSTMASCSSLLCVCVCVCLVLPCYPLIINGTQATFAGSKDGFSPNALSCYGCKLKDDLQYPWNSHFRVLIDSKVVYRCC